MLITGSHTHTHTYTHTHTMKYYFPYDFFNGMCVLVVQSCPTLCDPMDCSPPGFSVRRILQARVLEWVVISFSRGRMDRTLVFCIAGRFFNI